MSKKKPLEYPFIMFLAKHLAYGLNNLLCHTVRWKNVNYEAVEEVMKEGGVIFLWHENIMASIYNSRGRGIWTISSTHRDSMLQEFILRKYKYNFVKGSSKHNGAKALLGVLKGLKDNNFFAITCDGPSGPRHEVQPGAVPMIKKSGKRFLFLGVALKDKWVFEKSWDKHQIPKFFSKGVLSYSEIQTYDGQMTDDELLEFIKQGINTETQKAQELLNQN